MRVLFGLQVEQQEAKHTHCQPGVVSLIIRAAKKRCERCCPRACCSNACSERVCSWRQESSLNLCSITLQRQYEDLVWHAV